LFSKNKEKGSVITYIPADTEIKVKGHYKYQKIKYNDYVGWINTSSLIYPNTKKYLPNEKRSKTSTTIRNTNSWGTVQVKGYYRKDGTLHFNPTIQSSNYPMANC
jgi:hypothetical protein